MIREGETRSRRLQLGEDKDQRFLQGIGPAGITTGQISEALGLLTPVGGLTAQVLDHPAGGIGLSGEGSFVAFFCQQGCLQLGEG